MPRCKYVENNIEIECDKCQEIMLAEHDKQIRADAIKDFANRLLNNEVIDKSVIRRVSEQMQKGKEIDKGNND